MNGLVVKEFGGEWECPILQDDGSIKMYVESNRFPCACYSRIIDGVLVRSRQLDAFSIP